MLAPLLAVVALALPGSTAPDPTAYWQHRPGCETGHGYPKARRSLRRVLRQPRPISARGLERARDARVCMRSRAGRHRAERLARKLRRWRLAYPRAWPIRFHRLPSWTQAWAWSTGACESGNNPSTNTGNGFYGAFQFMLPTWYAAGGDRFPTAASWHHQAVIAVNWMLRTSDEQWPVCGD